MADSLLHLSERSDKRPCGAGTKTSGMEAGTCPHGRLDGVAGGRSSCRGQGTGDRGRIHELIAGLPTDRVSAMVALYLNVFVGIVQAFQKVSALKAMAPKHARPDRIERRLLI